MEELKKLRKELIHQVTVLEEVEFVHKKDITEFMQGVLTISRDNVTQDLRGLIGKIEIVLDM